MNSLEIYREWDKKFYSQVKWGITYGEFIYIQHININFMPTKLKL